MKLVAALLLWLFVSPAVTLAQETPSQRLREDKCTACKLTLRPGPRLGEARGGGMITANVRSVKTTSDGRFIASLYDWKEGELLVFAADGRFQRRVTREGAGPGESRGIGVFDVVPGDSILVSDLGNGRLLRFDPQLRFIDSRPSVPVAMAGGILGLRNGSLAINGTIPTSEHVGYVIHTLDPALRLTHSGALQSGAHPNQHLRAMRLLTRSSTGGFWAAAHTEYALTLFDSVGRPIRQLVRDVPWFRKHNGDRKMEVAESPPLLLSIQEDERGLLWVLLALSDKKNWRKGIAPAGSPLPDGSPSALPVVTDQDAYLDSRIEVIDPEKGTVVLSVTLPHALHHLVKPNHAAAQVIDADGAVVVKTWKMIHNLSLLRR